MSHELVYLIFGLFLGVVIGVAMMYFYFKGLLLRERTLLESTVSQKDQQFTSYKESAEQTLKQQREFLDQRMKDQEGNENKIKDQFTLVAQEVLSKNLEAQVKALQTQNVHDLDKKKQEFTQSFEEIKSHLKTTGEKIQLFEKERTDQYAKIEKQIETISLQEQKLIMETERLKSALTTSQSVRGRWGELVLRNILAQSDMVQGIDFVEQAFVHGSEGSALKPDFVIKLPQSGQHLVIDSKASIFDSYLESEQAQTEAGRKELHQDFAKRLRTRVQDLSGKEYQKYLNENIDHLKNILKKYPPEFLIITKYENILKNKFSLNKL